MPEMFPPGTDEIHKMWMSSVYSVAEGVVCVSRATADEVAKWLKTVSHKRLRPFKIGRFHNGADIQNSDSTRGIPDDAMQFLAQLLRLPSFLMVGTIEPRKGYLQAVEAFQQLWSEGVDLNLVIVGKEGWKDVPTMMRRTIPKIVYMLRHHPELGNRLFWVENISDEYLDRVYASCTCLIEASEGDGFGLPLIEAAQHKLPIIARDIPVFNEVAGKHAYYFSGKKPSDLAKAIIEWLSLYRLGCYPRSDDMPRLTCKQSAKELMDIIFQEQ
jgi:glycosyltransferase involved in cell wall biosynthesis